MENVSITLETVGTLLIAWAALRVHHRVLNEHKVSSRVFRIMRIEQRLGIVGMVFVFAGYLLNLLY
ncbi:TPA: hypothetical protein DIS55_03710 [Candidatus Kaiserbacteria bacterium]|nr:hypothetical protein [Candidatus Kaiserbacteria bacterium]